jgi:hypothetical protein
MAKRNDNYQYLRNTTTLLDAMDYQIGAKVSDELNIHQ